MSTFYGSVEGSARTLATRRGSKVSGIIGHIRGWDNGVKVYGYVDRDGSEVFDVFLTGGSNDPSGYIRLAHIVDGTLEDSATVDYPDGRKTCSCGTAWADDPGHDDHSARALER